MQKTILHPEVGDVTLSRTRRSTRITLSVRADGHVRLSFPVWVTQRRALQFLEEKLDWIAQSREKIAKKAPPQKPDTPPQTEEQKATQKAKEKRAIEALRAEAKIKLPAMTARLAAQHSFRHGAVRVKLTKSRWGSCTARGDINLSLSLAALPDHLAEYIVLHELCHTVHRNHSPRFHALLDRVTDGRHRALNRELRAYRPGVIMNQES
ncbi:MAG: M48 family metallopeptidase [Alistipes sp.]|jgi:predicted metal-dependent hydrolase|nr:M48 family metallopeptidase [Alistipes sp.]